LSGDVLVPVSSKLLKKAIEAHQAGRLQEARAQYRKVLTLAPQDPNALHFFGVLRHRLGESGPAIEMIRRSLEVAPGNAHAWVNLGNIYLERDEPDEARRAYEEATQLDSKQADGWYNLGVCLRRLEDASGAVAALNAAIALRPEHAAAFYQRGIARRELEDLDGANEDFGRALTLKPDYLEVYESLGMLLYRMNRIAQAAAVYRDWLARDPSSSIAAHMAAATSGEQVPERSSDLYVTETFDRFAATFDANLANLAYRAPNIVATALERRLAGHRLDCILDAGCGTGLCGPLLRGHAQCLVGVDLSPVMLELARGKGVYDELHAAELSAFMHRSAAQYDAIVSADTFVYFGVLETVFAAAAAALHGAGWFVFTLEQCADSAAPYRLEPHGRYTHHQDYVRDCLARAGFEAIECTDEILRRERGADVHGMLVSAVHRGPAQAQV
jgi:predicted TPR repeat methyltransferase